MAVFFRATVMLLVLVGLPTAWVYYGPLPPEAMGVIQRTLASAKHSLGLSDQSPSNSWADAPKTAPKFDASLAQDTSPQSTFAVPPTAPAPRFKTDPNFSLASATTSPPSVTHDSSHPDLAEQLAPHLSLLRSLNAEEYTLENWGGSGQLYRFRCEIPLGENQDFTQQFEAIDADPLRAVHQVVGEVTSFQNARHTPDTSYWR